MSVNILWLCSIMMGGWTPSPLGGTAPNSFTMMLHGVVGIIVAEDLKTTCRSERLKGYRHFLVVNGAFIVLEVILLAYEIAFIFAKPYWTQGDEWLYGVNVLSADFVTRGSLQRTFYMLVAISLNVFIQLIVRSMCKRAMRPCPSAPPAYIA